MQQNSLIKGRDLEAEKEFSKIDMVNSKLKDARTHQRNIGRNVNKNVPSPRSPKVKSITDKSSPSPKVINSGGKSTGFNAYNKKSPKNYPKGRY